MVYLFIIDKETAFIKGLKATFETEQDNISVIGHSSTINKAMDFIQKNQADIILYDPSTSESLNKASFNKIKEVNEKIKIVILTNELDINYLNNLWNFGVDGIELKNCGKKALIQIIKDVLNGKRVIGKKLPDFLRETCISAEPAKLSIKENEIYKLLKAGFNCEDIANKLKLPIIAVQFHCKNILKKVNRNKTFPEGASKENKFLLV